MTTDRRSIVRVLLGIGGLFLITLPFVWLKLNFNYSAGTIGLEWDGAKGGKLLLDLLPVLGVILVMVPVVVLEVAGVST